MTIGPQRRGVQPLADGVVRRGALMCGPEQHDDRPLVGARHVDGGRKPVDGDHGRRH